MARKRSVVGCDLHGLSQTEGVWRVQLEFNGRRVRRRLGKVTEVEAKQIRDGLWKELVNAPADDFKAPTLEAAIIAYLVSFPEKRQRQMLYLAVDLLNHFGQARPITEIRYSQLKAYQTAALGKKRTRRERWSPATVNRATALIKTAITRAVDPDDPPVEMLKTIESLRRVKKLNEAENRTPHRKRHVGQAQPSD